MSMGHVYEYDIALHLLELGRLEDSLTTSDGDNVSLQENSYEYFTSRDV